MGLVAVSNVEKTDSLHPRGDPKERMRILSWDSLSTESFKWQEESAQRSAALRYVGAPQLALDSPSTRPRLALDSPSTRPQLALD